MENSAKECEINYQVCPPYVTVEPTFPVNLLLLIVNMPLLRSACHLQVTKHTPVTKYMYDILNYVGIASSFLENTLASAGQNYNRFILE